MKKSGPSVNFDTCLDGSICIEQRHLRMEDISFLKSPMGFDPEDADANAPFEKKLVDLLNDRIEQIESDIVMLTLFIEAMRRIRISGPKEAQQKQGEALAGALFARLNEREELLQQHGLLHYMKDSLAGEDAEHPKINLSEGLYVPDNRVVAAPGVVLTDG